MDRRRSSGAARGPAAASALPAPRGRHGGGLGDPTSRGSGRLLVEIVEQAHARGELDNQDEAFDDAPFVDLLDALVVESDPRGGRLLELMRERGWTGWTRLERTEQAG